MIHEIFFSGMDQIWLPQEAFLEEIRPEIKCSMWSFDRDWKTNLQSPGCARCVDDKLMQFLWDYVANTNGNPLQVFQFRREVRGRGGKNSLTVEIKHFV